MQMDAEELENPDDGGHGGELLQLLIALANLSNDEAIEDAYHVENGTKRSISRRSRKNSRSSIVGRISDGLEHEIEMMKRASEVANSGVSSDEFVKQLNFDLASSQEAEKQGSKERPARVTIAVDPAEVVETSPREGDDDEAARRRPASRRHKTILMKKMAAIFDDADADDQGETPTGRKYISAAEASLKFVRCLERVISEQRAQFVQHRLQELVISTRRPKSAPFELPDSLKSPRGVHEPGRRYDWWRHFHGHPDLIRKRPRQDVSDLFLAITHPNVENSHHRGGMNIDAVADLRSPEDDPDHLSLKARAAKASKEATSVRSGSESNATTKHALGVLRPGLCEADLAPKHQFHVPKKPIQGIPKERQKDSGMLGALIGDDSDSDASYEEPTKSRTVEDRLAEIAGRTRGDDHHGRRHGVDSDTVSMAAGSLAASDKMQRLVIEDGQVVEVCSSRSSTSSYSSVSAPSPRSTAGGSPQSSTAGRPSKTVSRSNSNASRQTKHDSGSQAAVQFKKASTSRLSKRPASFFQSQSSAASIAASTVEASDDEAGNMAQRPSSVKSNSRSESALSPSAQSPSWPDGGGSSPSSRPASREVGVTFAAQMGQTSQKRSEDIAKGALLKNKRWTMKPPSGSEQYKCYRFGVANALTAKPNVVKASSAVMQAAWKEFGWRPTVTASGAPDITSWDDGSSQTSIVENPADLLQCLSGTDNMPEPQKLERRLMWGGVLTEVKGTHSKKMTQRRDPETVETAWQKGRWDSRLQFILGDLCHVESWTVEKVENMIQTGHYEGVGTVRNADIQKKNPGSFCESKSRLFDSPVDDPEQERLPPPPRKLWLHDPAQSAEADRVANSYLDEIVTRRVVPGVPRSLQLSDGIPKPLDLRNLDLTDDVFACISAGLKHRSGDFTGILLAGNPRLTCVSHVGLFQLLNERTLNHNDHVMILDLSGAKFTEEALRILGESFHSKLAQLQSLNLRGVTVPSCSWPSLAEALRRLPKLEELVLADTQIGRETQRSALAAVDAFIGLTCLTNLDISRNFFGFEGCRALADYMAFNKALVTLDLSFNAGGFVPAQENVSRKHKKGDSNILYNPLLLVCEAVAHARALENLTLTQCQLGFDEDFVLEDGCAEASANKVNGLRMLDLCGNPLQGPSGARCLMRLIIRTPELNNLYVTEFRAARPPANSVAYEFVDPTAHYELNLAHPQHRALLRTLLRRCEDEGALPAEQAMDWLDKKKGQTLLQSWKSHRQIPTEGLISFHFRQEAPRPDQYEDIDELRAAVANARKLHVTLWAFVRVVELFESLRDEMARRVLLDAMASDLLLKLCHVKYLAKKNTGLYCEVIENLLPSIAHLNRNGGFGIVLDARGLGTAGLLRRTLTYLLFCPRVPDGRYELDIEAPVDHAVAEGMMLVNEWDKALAHELDVVDLSQHGKHEGLRNVVLGGKKVAWFSEEFSLPNRGQMTFDYATPFREREGQWVLPKNIHKALLRAYSNAKCMPGDKVGALRSILHRFALEPIQCAAFIQSLPEWQPHLGDFKRSPRVELFIAMFARCVDTMAILTDEPHGLFGLELLAREEVLAVRQRLGRQRTFDCLRCHEECWMAGGNMVVPGLGKKAALNQKAKQDLREQESVHFQRIMRDLQLRDNCISKVDANKYVLDLSVHEDWSIARYLLALAQREDGENICETSWTEKAQFDARGIQFIVPSEWYSHLPTVGVFTMRYFLERPQYKEPPSRIKLANKMLGWKNYNLKTGLQAPGTTTERARQSMRKSIGAGKNKFGMDVK